MSRGVPPTRTRLAQLLHFVTGRYPGDLSPRIGFEPLGAWLRKCLEPETWDPAAAGGRSDPPVDRSGADPCPHDALN